MATLLKVTLLALAGAVLALALTDPSLAGWDRTPSGAAASFGWTT
jgi:hypothetical protein